MIVVAALLVGIFRVPITRAATLSIMTSPSVVVGQPFRVDIALDTQGDDMNAIQGEISFPPSLLTFKNIDDGDSPVSLWIEPPHETSSGTIVFSGIIPGGFTGNASSVVGVMFVPVVSGTGTIGIDNAELLRNDGQGSVIALTKTGQTIAIGSSVAGPSGVSLPPSTTPQKFTPTIANNPNIYGGSYFLVFSTTDKGSGIDHYDVLEVPAGESIGKDPLWVAAASPYLLKDQTLSSDIYVRAVNNDGGSTIVKVPARFPKNIVAQAGSVGFTLLLVVLIILLLYLVVRRRRGQRSA
jgi:hypothetical protein